MFRPEGAVSLGAKLAETGFTHRLVVLRLALWNLASTRKYELGDVRVPFSAAPRRWKSSCANKECSLHQLSPYIGKIKSSIAADLIADYTRPGEQVVDPFAGAGTIPLEAAMAGRHAFGADISPYARILSLAKLFPPRTLAAAISAAEHALAEAAELPVPDLRRVPVWVRDFFHPATLRETLNFATVCRAPGREFLMACLLGILHHQRPGFLSYPSSHLVPYLRDKKYPREAYPDMYAYRPLRPRLIAKVVRSYKRIACFPTGRVAFRQCAVQELVLPRRFDALITSPPYMNALDYGRDNRLRLWFIDPTLAREVDNEVTKRREGFRDAIRSLAKKVNAGLKRRGHCIFVVGEEFNRKYDAHPSEVVVATMRAEAPSLRLRHVVSDNIPDVRRTRRECHGVKTEHFLVFQRN